MKCIICGKRFEKNECPVCHFPIIDFPCDITVGMQSIMPEVISYREIFAARVNIGLVNYYYIFRNDQIYEANEERIFLGSATELFQKDTWLCRTYENLTDTDRVDICLYIRADNQEFRRCVSVPVIHDAEALEIGITLDKDFRFCINIRSEIGEICKSDFYDLFD